jgi:hypothetical protein
MNEQGCAQVSQIVQSANRSVRSVCGDRLNGIMNERGCVQAVQSMNEGVQGPIEWFYERTRLCTGQSSCAVIEKECGGTDQMVL